MNKINSIILCILLQGCYGNDNDPGSTTYCRTVGKVGNDANCEKEDTTFSEFNMQLLYQNLRCSAPLRITDRVSNTCYPEASDNLVFEVNESETSLSRSRITNSKVSTLDGKKIGSFCPREKEDPFSDTFTLFQKFYKFDQEKREIGKVIWSQDPNDEVNKSIKENRNKAIKFKIVPMPTSILVGEKWIVTTSQCTNGIMGTIYLYQIIEVGQ
ncbi:hypothetical protein EHQ58_05225 [Leptospira ognonensis]|uniref:Lipoprotein n=1 Tax=Leptospira ognonensis TaxID=2484945 RepID=A0A4R9K9U4_9LEPT|nr:hypothetical protein [Leptospira ognonensis]TGL61524.1 hypothetical protein EHQ58_05225 [Leptospira ognonensis]